MLVNCLLICHPPSIKIAPATPSGRLRSSLGGCFSDFTAKVVESMQAMRRHAPRPPFDLTEAKLKAMTSEAENFYSQYQGQHLGLDMT